MAMQVVQDSTALLDSLRGGDAPVVLGFFGEFSESSRRARPAFEKFCSEHPQQPAWLVDVGATRDLHQRFGVASVPTVIVVRGEAVLRKFVGVQPDGFYDWALLDQAAPAPAADGTDKKPSHSVVVYVTDTCPWCTRVKAYLRKNGVSYREINVSRDEREARRMVEKSGQQGVPQVDIDGHVVVGFDRARIDSLLGIKGSADA
jgi:glutaredoxin-like YruB-family protein